MFFLFFRREPFLCLGTAAAVAVKAGCVQLVKTAANCCSPRKKPDFSRCFGGRGELWGRILGSGRGVREVSEKRVRGTIVNGNSLPGSSGLPGMLCVPAAGFLRVTTAAAGGKPGLRAD
jgi:hypothetical protein